MRNGVIVVKARLGPKSDWGHRRAHVSASLVVVLVLVCLAPHCFSESKGLSRSIELGGAVEDADISPDGGYVAAAVRKCGIPGASRTCRLDIEIWTGECEAAR